MTIEIGPPFKRITSVPRALYEEISVAHGGTSESEFSVLIGPEQYRVRPLPKFGLDKQGRVQAAIALWERPPSNPTADVTLAEVYLLVELPKPGRSRFCDRLEYLFKLRARVVRDELYLHQLNGMLGNSYRGLDLMTYEGEPDYAGLIMLMMRRGQELAKDISPRAIANAA